ncbi:hypothetical protein D3C87_646170 [compost metagenome]
MGRGFVFLTAKGAKFSQRNAKLEVWFWGLAFRPPTPDFRLFIQPQRVQRFSQSGQSWRNSYWRLGFRPLTPDLGLLTLDFRLSHISFILAAHR